MCLARFWKEGRRRWKGHLSTVRLEQERLQWGSEVRADRLVDNEFPTRRSYHPLHCIPCCLFPIAVPSPANSIYMLIVMSIPSPSGFRLSNPVCLLVTFCFPSAVPRCWREQPEENKMHFHSFLSTVMCLDCFGSYTSTGTSWQKGLAEECYSLVAVEKLEGKDPTARGKTCPSKTCF